MAEGSLFAKYEREYCARSTEASKRILVVSSLSGDARRAKLKEISADLDAAERVLQRLDMEARATDPATSRLLLRKSSEYRADLTKLRADARQAAAAAPPGAEARAELGLSDELAATTAAQRERLLHATDRASQTGERIKQGRQQLAETEELGIQILADLQRQRETIVHSRDALAGIDENVSRSRQILASMSRRILQNKLLMWGVVALLVFAVLLVAWAKH